MVGNTLRVLCNRLSTNLLTGSREEILCNSSALGSPKSGQAVRSTAQLSEKYIAFGGWLQKLNWFFIAVFVFVFNSVYECPLNMLRPDMTSLLFFRELVCSTLRHELIGISLDLHVLQRYACRVLQ